MINMEKSNVPSTGPAPTAPPPGAGASLEELENEARQLAADFATLPQALTDKAALNAACYTRLMGLYSRAVQSVRSGDDLARIARAWRLVERLTRFAEIIIAEGVPKAAPVWPSIIGLREKAGRLAELHD